MKGVRPILFSAAQCCITDLRLPVSRDDAQFPLFQELTRQGVSLPSSLVGSLFEFSNRLVKLDVFLSFSPDHVGVPDVTSKNAGVVPPQWVPFAPKWRRWTTDWAEVQQAGLNGSLSLGPLPERWSNLELKSERSTPIVQPKLDAEYVGTVPLGGHNWPLPPGAWTVMASKPQMIDQQIVADQIFLADLTKGAVRGTVRLAFSRPDLQTPVKEPDKICQLPPDYLTGRARFEPGYQQDCWAIRINEISVLRKNMDGYQAFEAAVRARGLQMPKTILYSMLAIVDRDRSASAFYGFPATLIANRLTPSEADKVVAWSPWNGPIGPIRTKAFRAMHDWVHA